MCAFQAVQTKQAPPQLITASVLLIVSGCVVAGLGDFSFDIKGWPPPPSPSNLRP